LYRFNNAYTFVSEVDRNTISVKLKETLKENIQIL